MNKNLHVYVKIYNLNIPGYIFNIFIVIILILMITIMLIIVNLELRTREMYTYDKRYINRIIKSKKERYAKLMKKVYFL